MSNSYISINPAGSSTNIPYTLVQRDASGNVALNGLTLTVPLTPSNGGTGTSTVFTPGSVVFAGPSGVYAQDNSNLFWDDANNRLGVLTNTPTTAIQIGGYSNVFSIGDYNTARIDSDQAATGYGRFYSQNRITLQANNGDANGTVVALNYQTNEILTVTTSYRVGINNTNPQYSLDVGGVSAASTLLLKGSTSGTFSQTAAATTTAYAVTWPAIQGAANTVPVNNGSGILSWSVPPITNIEVAATATVTTTSGTDSVITGMTSTPAAGTYMVFFSSSFTQSNAGSTITVSLYSATTQKTDSVRTIIPFTTGITIGGSTQYMVLSTHGIFTVNGSQALTAQWHTSGGTASAYQKTFTLIRLA